MEFQTSNDLQIMGMIYESLYNNTIHTSIQDLPNRKPYGFWLSYGSDKFCLVSHVEHRIIARNVIEANPAMFKYSDIMGGLYDGNDPYDIMYANKWFRIVTEIEYLGYECPKVSVNGKFLISEPAINSVDPSAKQLSWMEYVCGLYGIPKIKDSLGRVIWTRDQSV